MGRMFNNLKSGAEWSRYLDKVMAMMALFCNLKTGVKWLFVAEQSRYLPLFPFPI